MFSGASYVRKEERKKNPFEQGVLFFERKEEVPSFSSSTPLIACCRLGDLHAERHYKSGRQVMNAAARYLALCTLKRLAHTHTQYRHPSIFLKEATFSPKRGNETKEEVKINHKFSEANK